MRALDTAAGHLDACGRRLHGHLAGQLDTCAATIDRCDSSCAGCVHLHCDQAEAMAQKCAAKIDDFLVGKLSFCYATLARFGVSFPSTGELESAAGTDGRPFPAPMPEAAQPLAAPQPALLAAGESSFPALDELDEARPDIPPPTSPESLGGLATLPDSPSPLPAGGPTVLPGMGVRPLLEPPGKPKTACQEIDICRDGAFWWWLTWWSWWYRWWYYWFWFYFRWWWRWYSYRYGRPGDPGTAPTQAESLVPLDSMGDPVLTGLDEPEFPLELPR
jgi:hypothetical protein